ncbi:protein translocase, SecG subunit [Burkholderiales bacterium JOSHI_001]|nr:protein translocase, SecG subunit [Burkholderiales bacterium JOSHI_001]
MQVWMNIVLVVQLLAAMAMIGLVLVQHGKGADMGASFGSGASGSLFGATGSANFLSRSTAVCAGLFFVCTLALGVLANNGGAVRGSGTSSVLDRAATATPAASAGSAAAGAASAALAAASAPAAAASGVPAIPTK